MRCTNGETTTPTTTLQDTTTATIKALTDKINRLESGSEGRGSGGRHNGGRERSGYRELGSKNFPRNNDGGTRMTHRWDNGNYCWTCGFDIKHISMTCAYFKDSTTLKKEATATNNTMGGSTCNLHISGHEKLRGMIK